MPSAASAASPASFVSPSMKTSAPEIGARHDPETHLGDRFGHLRHRVVRIDEPQVHGLARMIVSRQARGHELPCALLGDTGRHDREDVRLRAQKHPLGPVGMRQ